MSKYCHNEISSSFLFLIVYNYVASKGYLPLLVFRENALTEEATYIPVYSLKTPVFTSNIFYCKNLIHDICNYV